MALFEVDVAVATHDEVHAGNFLANWHRATVEASDGDEAILIACQLVSAVCETPTGQASLPTDAVLCL